MKQRSERIEAIFQNFGAIKREFSHGSRLSHRRFGMTMTQASVLMLLMHEGRKTMGEMSSALGVSKGAATQLLEGLIEKGYVERAQDEDDKRVAYVSVSSKGLRHFKHARERGGQRMSQLFDLLDDTELEQIETITTKLAERAKEIRK
jgi:MarR family 2-MHQ and catechol resistance regulon transcriptional repressor